MTISEYQKGAEGYAGYFDNLIDSSSGPAGPFVLFVMKVVAVVDTQVGPAVVGMLVLPSAH